MTILFIVAITFNNNAFCQKNKKDTKPLYIGKVFPIQSLSTIDGVSYDLQKINNKVTIISYWAFWCSACLEERPVLERIYKEFKGKELEVFSLHSPIGMFNNYKKEKELVEKTLKKYPTSFPNLMRVDSKQMDNALIIKSIPVTLLIDKKGVIRFQEIGFDKESFYKRIKNNVMSLLEEK